MRHHVLRNALTPVITILGLSLGVLLTQRRADRDGVLVERARVVRGRGDAPPRLPGDQRRVHRRRRHLPAQQPRRRRPLRRRRPEDQVRMSDGPASVLDDRALVTAPPTPARRGGAPRRRCARGRDRRSAPACIACCGSIVALDGAAVGVGGPRRETVGDSPAAARAASHLARHRRARPRRAHAHAVRRPRLAADRGRRDRAARC